MRPRWSHLGEKTASEDEATASIPNFPHPPSLILHLRGHMFRDPPSLSLMPPAHTQGGSEGFGHEKFLEET